MYLGVVTNRHFKSERIKKFYNDYSDYPNLSDSIGYISVDLCNQNGKLNSIFISTSKCSYQGDLVNLVYENGNWIVKEIIDDYNVKKLSINQILQLEKLIELEKLKLKEEKKEYAESYLKRDSLFFEIVRRELRIEDLVKKFNLAIKNVSTKIEYIKLKKDSSYRQSIEFIEKIIYSLRTNELSLFFWLMYASSILHLSNNNINEELLTRAIELLLNVKIANNEINELKLQLEQQLKQKLTELKGKQKRLV
mgnify:CR=1 FL=1